MIHNNYFFILKVGRIIFCYTNLILFLFREEEFCTFRDHTLFLLTGPNLPNLIILIFIALSIIPNFMMNLVIAERRLHFFPIISQISNKTHNVF